MSNVSNGSKGSTGKGVAVKSNTVVDNKKVVATKAALKPQGVKAISNGTQRNQLITAAKKGTLKPVVEKSRIAFVDAFKGYNMSNIYSGNVEKTAFGHKVQSKAGSCDYLIITAAKGNINLSTLVDKLVNHYGVHTKQATLTALRDKVKAHNATKSTGSNYYLSKVFTSRLFKANKTMTVKQREILASFSDTLAFSVNMVFNQRIANEQKAADKKAADKKAAIVAAAK